jgi:hypothetical protein
MESLGRSIQSFRKGLKEPPEIDVTPRDGDTTPTNESGGRSDGVK